MHADVASFARWNEFVSRSKISLEEPGSVPSLASKTSFWIGSFPIPTHRVSMNGKGKIDSRDNARPVEGSKIKRKLGATKKYTRKTKGIRKCKENRERRRLGIKAKEWEGVREIKLGSENKMKERRKRENRRDERTSVGGTDAAERSRRSLISQFLCKRAKAGSI